MFFCEFCKILRAPFFYRTPLDDLNFFICFTVFFVMQWTNRNQVFSTFEHVLSCLLNVMNIRCSQTFVKTHRKTPVQESFLINLHAWGLQLYWKETYEVSVIVRNLFHKILWLVPSEPTSTKLGKLCIVCINYLSVKRQNGWAGDTRCPLLKSIL